MIELASSAIDHPEVSSPLYWTSQSMDGGDTLAGARVANALTRRDQNLPLTLSLPCCQYCIQPSQPLPPFCLLHLQYHPTHTLCIHLYILGKQILFFSHEFCPHHLCISLYIMNKKSLFFTNTT